MKIHLYTNNAYDTIALIADDGQVTSTWEANAPGGIHETALEDALYTDDLSGWDEQGKDVDPDDFEEGQALFLIINEDGSWETYDKDLTFSRLAFHLGQNHPIVKALSL